MPRIHRPSEPRDQRLAPRGPAVAATGPAVQRLQRLQRLADARVSPAASIQRAAGPLQLKPRSEIIREFRDGLLLANFSGAFIARHIGLGNNDNLAAARIHQSRPAPPPINTVVMDAHALKASLADGVWTDQGAHWQVVSNGNVELQDTRRRGQAIGDPPASPDLLKSPTRGEDAERFTVRDGVVVAVEGASDLEVQAAVQVAGPYPSGSGKTIKARRRDYRVSLVREINNSRIAAARDRETVWVKANFRSIGGVALTGNGAPATRADILNIARRTEQVTVFVRQSDGRIYHFDGYN